MTVDRSPFVAADQLDEEARRAIRRLDDLLPILAGIPIYVSLHSSLSYMREGLRDATARYERAKAAE